MLELTVHERTSTETKNPNSMAQKLMRAHLDCKSYMGAPMPDEVVASEAEVTMWGGVIDLGNLMPFGTFMIAADDGLQYRLYQELQSVWPDVHAPPPDYLTLRKLPLLVRLTKVMMKSRPNILHSTPL